MKRLNAFLVSVLATVALNAAEANTAVIEQVIVRQQWPWSTDVKIEYKLKDVSSPVDVSVEAYNGDEKLDQARLDESLSGDRFGVTDVVGTIILDPVKAFGTEKVALANFKVKLSLSQSAADSQDIFYKIIDLADGFKVTNVRRCDFQNGKMGAYETDFKAIDPTYWTGLSDVLIWTGVTNNPDYFTTKLVMRRIPTEGVVTGTGAWGYYSKGQEENCGKISHVTFSSDYYISVFEVTEKQIELLSEKTFSSSGADFPVTSICHEQLLGDPASWIGWPTDKHAVAAGSVIDIIRAKVPGMMFDLPTEAQWQYAAEAGTTNDLYIGSRVSSATAFSAASVKLAWTSNTEKKIRRGGLLRPNAFGLYDMLGNVAEICRDMSDTELAPLIDEPTEDPIGLTDVTLPRFLARGGSYSFADSLSTTYRRRVWGVRSWKEGGLGVRLYLKGE